MRSRPRPTIREVARLAGVSHQTVSRYLKTDDTISKALQQRIATAIAQLDYRPNLVARAMRSRKTGRLAFLLPPGTAISSLEMLTGAKTEAHSAGYVVEVVTLDGSPDTRTDRVLELADSGLFEGLVSLTALPDVSSRRDPQGPPIIVAPHYDEHMRSVGELADAPAVEEFITRLADQGHRRFVHLAGDYVHMSARRRREVYIETIERLGLDSYGVIDCDWLAQRARQAILDLPEGSGVTAVIAANDVLAVGAISGAYLRGWLVPGDLSVTGWDDNPVAAAMTPAVTTVSVDYQSLGRRAVSRLLATLRGEEAPESREPVSAAIWRESTGPAPTT
ncbi:LacI family DNA-binding transcriptional regulator [Phytohabitans aurantiacus]|jgi:DNA-binding LacI/PurR family transcriptional regulator|uniref:LacI family transcriptional regulator n=1 Tax=Phytohabitans aurantiacus TaxID=3016789 RepID=A0ABQ5R6A7_9ACTN|nr:LacI family DNA-binding transcriptional regulator [Phytohabitans aurantiacus]GLI01490.1 LacI family transcriptional regulator [Phytohabitans aurantiacus]